MVAGTFFTLLGLLAFGDALGELSHGVNLLLGILFFTASVVVRRRLFQPGGLLAVLFLLGVAVLGVRGYEVLAVPLLMLGLTAWVRPEDEQADGWFRDLAAASAWCLVYVLYRHNPYLHMAADRLCLSFSIPLSMLWRIPIQYASTAMALPLWMLFLFALFAHTHARRGAWKMRLAGTIGLLLAVTLYCGFHAHLFEWRDGWKPYVDLRNQSVNAEQVGQARLRPFSLLVVLHYLLPTNAEPIAALLAIGVLFLVLRSGRSHAPGSTPDRKARARWVWVLPGIALVLAGALLGMVQRPSTVRGGKVLLFDKHLDWSVPTYERYGTTSSGMFGRLPRLLESRGFQARLGPPSEEDLEWADVLIVINLQIPFTAEESERIRSFVEEGGGLLALGDHTGTTGIREPMNAMLKPFGIEFSFDSAKGFNNWLNEYELPCHPVVSAEERDFNRMNIWVGASLTPHFPAYPVVTGKYGWIDPGQLANVDRSYLGDLWYNQGEPLGDVYLVAAREYGRGRVVVFGDTSSFQNSALTGSFAFALRTVAWLASRPLISFPTRTAAGAFLIVLGLLLLIGIRMQTARVPTWQWAIVVSLALAGAVNAFLARVEAGRFPPCQGPVGYMDFSHNPDVACSGWKWPNDVGAVEVNLQRAGYSSEAIWNWPSSLPAPGTAETAADAVFVSLAPRAPYSGSEMDQLTAFVNQGGTLLVTAGPACAEGASSILSPFGAEVLNVPLGVGTESLTSAGIHMPSAWPVVWDATGVVSLCDLAGYSVVGERRVGQGRVVVIGDPKFLLNNNLEWRERGREQPPRVNNILFLRRLLLGPCTGAPPSREETGPPPPSEGLPDDLPPGDSVPEKEVGS